MYDFTVILTVLYHVVKAPSDIHRNVLTPSLGYRKYYPNTYLEELKKIEKPQTQSWSLKFRLECRIFRL
jgi:hypothetical protein